MKSITRMAAATTLALLLAGMAQAYQTDFEGFSLGPINGQEGWTTEDSFGNDPTDAGKPVDFDEAVIVEGDGNKAWRISDAYTYTEYAFQPCTPTTDEVAGEPGSYLYNDYGDDHTNPNNPPLAGSPAATPYFYAAFDIKSATGTPQTGLGLSLSPTAKQSTVRNGYLGISDNGVDGIDIWFYGTGSVSDPWGQFGGDDYTQVADSLSYDDYHRVEMLIQFVDGLQDVGGEQFGNDIVQVFIDGDLKHTGTTWESYYAGPAEGPREQAVDSLMFRNAGGADIGNLGGGFLFDNVEISNVPEPATLSLLALGGLALARRRRK